MLVQACLLLGAAIGDLRTPDPEPVPIVGGRSTEPGEFDNVVAIYDGMSLCTGTVVDAGLVLTAAHCLANAGSASQLQILYGDQTDANPPLVASDFGAHPEFDPNADYDIFDYGWVRVDGLPVVDRIMLPITEQDEWDEAIGKGGAVTVVGYGEDPDAPGLQHGIGEKREVQTVIHRQTPRGFEFYAGGMNKDSCNGDSGGPAFAKLVSGTWRLAGVTSRGSSPCGQGGYYGVPYPALGWLRDETGVDLCGPDCPTCDCLDMSPPKEEGCRVHPERDIKGLAWILLLGFSTRRRGRAAPTIRRAKPAGASLPRRYRA